MEINSFIPSDIALEQKLSAINPSVYAKTRNHLGGNVTLLSPYITHGYVAVTSIAQRLQQKYALTFQDKIIFEFAWRSFFHHVWAAKGEGIFNSIYEPIYAGSYLSTLPDDIAQGRTGVPVIDASVRELYATGYLHNHARMWLASYVVHLRKVDWCVGAAWLYAHLLDGDCASNHLSWQWVAGTFSSKPYLFNAQNVALFAPDPAFKHWHSSVTVIDQSYEALDQWARSSKTAQAERGYHPSVDQPRVQSVPEQYVTSANLQQTVQGKSVRLFHPWDLASLPKLAGVIDVAWLCPAFHQSHPWSEKRWDWVMSRMTDLSPWLMVGDADTLNATLQGAASVQVQHTKNASYQQAITQLSRSMPNLNALPEPMFLPQLPMLCNSFTKFYQTAQKRVGKLENCFTTDGQSTSASTPQPIQQS